MKGFHRLLLAFFLGVSVLLPACDRSEDMNDNGEVAANSAIRLASTVEAEKTDPFGAALTEAMEAATRVQDADGSEDWQSVVALWQRSITLLQSLPESDSNYTVAQQKIQEYQVNLDYAQQNFLNASLGNALVDTASTPNEIQSLIDRGANPRYVEPNVFGEQTAKLYYAATFGNDHAVRILLNEGATWDQLTSEQLDDALISASCNGFFFNVQELLKAGANPNGLPDNDEKPLAMSRSGVCREVDMNGPIKPGTRQHPAIEAALIAAGAK